MVRHHELAYSQWESLKGLLPGKRADLAGTAVDNRLFVLKTGIPWKDLPARYGKPNSVWKSDMTGGMAPGSGRCWPACLGIRIRRNCDSTSVKAHSIASKGRRGPQEK